MTKAAVKIVDGGRIVLPAAFRKALGVTTGDTLTLDLDGDELRVRSAKTERDAAIRRIQARLAKLPSTGRLASDELIAERRAEAARE